MCLEGRSEGTGGSYHKKLTRSKGCQPSLKVLCFIVSRPSLGLLYYTRQLDTVVMSHVVSVRAPLDICFMTPPCPYLSSTVKSGREAIKVIWKSFPARSNQKTKRPDAMKLDYIFLWHEGDLGQLRSKTSAIILKKTTTLCCHTYLYWVQVYLFINFLKQQQQKKKCICRNSLVTPLWLLQTR